ncbi:DUF6616 family protein [Pseudonocardia dioxanivorans]|jgi:hypothetical protein|uniref:DUF6616 family protein n=1 Tax=Pseudonocardia dioxanivorans TaxID=240495 RepID=UPI000CD0C656|nr:DUF6616 family protein [Pseudonocardia dioxanivorans]
MHTFIELWTPRPAWLALGADQRQAYLDAVAPALDKLVAAGVEIVGWGRIEDEPDGRGTGHRYVAIWRMPSAAEVALLRKLVADAGWFDYFEQVNAVSELGTPEAVLVDHVAV